MLYFLTSDGSPEHKLSPRKQEGLPERGGQVSTGRLPYRQKDDGSETGSLGDERKSRQPFAWAVR
ncbi:hypothetical protein [Kamptonema formosum]|uniref:hypothetical protein n=1 Tax=Kamptonema formosum TaxID=331992 RepID=UPI00034CBAEE|nr:hypothetical protein [Oscillatoria sp. PCC 10802]